MKRGAGRPGARSQLRKTVWIRSKELEIDLRNSEVSMHCQAEGWAPQLQICQRGTDVLRLEGTHETVMESNFSIKAHVHSPSKYGFLWGTLTVNT